MIQGATVAVFSVSSVLCDIVLFSSSRPPPLATRSAVSQTGSFITCSCPSNEATRFSSETASTPCVSCLPRGFSQFRHACCEYSQSRYFSVTYFYPDSYGCFEKRWRQLRFLAMELESRAGLVFHAVVGFAENFPTVLFGRHPRYSRASTVGVVGVRGGLLSPLYSSWRFWRGGKSATVDWRPGRCN